MLHKLIYSCVVVLILVGCVRASNNTDNEMKLTIYHYKVPCMGEGVQLCYVVKKDNGEKEFLHDPIEGFEYQWGYNYIISAEKKSIKNPMADGSSFTYKLKKLIKKEKVLSTEEFELPLIMEAQQLIENKNGICRYWEGIEIQTSSFTCAELAKGQSAVFRHSGDKAGLVLIKIK